MAVITVAKAKLHPSFVRTFCILWLEFSRKGEIPSFFATYLRSLLCRTQVRRRLREHKLSLAPLSPPCSLKPFGGRLHPYTPSRVLLALNDGGDNSGKSQITPIACPCLLYFRIFSISFVFYGCYSPEPATISVIS